MSLSSDLTSQVFDYLNANIDYAVLRNYEGLPEKNTSRDIDILVTRTAFLKKEKDIVNVIIACGFKIITLYRSEKLFTYVCAHASNGVAELVQFDFFFNASLFGIILLDARNVLDSKVYNGAVYHVSKEYEFLDKYLQMKFLKKPYPEKYQALKAEMTQSELLGDILKKVVGCRSFEEMEKMSSATLKRKKVLFNLKERPRELMYVYISFWVYYLKNLVAYKGYSIGFTGPDGSGKTTVIDTVEGELKKTYTGMEIFHFRPTLTPNLGDAAHKAKLKSDVDKDYSQPHRGGKTGKLSSLARLLYYSIDYLIGYFIRIRPILRKRNLVIFDRYYTDIIADSRRSRIFLNHRFLYWFGRIFIPKLDYNILLTADKDVILDRKQELNEEGINRINKKLDYLSDKKGYYLVLNNGTPSEAVQKILTIVVEAQHRKNLKRLGL